MGQSTQSTVTQVCDVSRLLDQALNPHAGPCTIPEQQIYRAEGDLALQGDPGLQSGGHSLQLRSGELDPKRFVGKSVITVDKVDHGLKQNTELQFFAYSSAYDLMAPAEQLDEEARVLENNGNLNFHLIKLLNSGHEGYTWEPQLW